MNSSTAALSADQIDRIHGKALWTLLERLKDNRTVLQFSVLNRDYERLTLITGLRRSDEGVHVLMDRPPGFDEAFRDPKGVRVRVEFLGEDRVQYAFRSTISAVTDDDIWVAPPEFAERIQRRRHFRIAPPVGTRISFHRGGEPLQAALLNVSEGGCLLAPERSCQGGPQLWPGLEIRDLRLWCHRERVKIDLRINKAVVKRVEKNPESNSVRYALQFTAVEVKSKDALREFIFNCQRDMLQRRSLLEGD